MTACCTPTQSTDCCAPAEALGGVAVLTDATTTDVCECDCDCVCTDGTCAPGCC
jgi:hypothetical protein